MREDAALPEIAHAESVPPAGKLPSGDSPARPGKPAQRWRALRRTVVILALGYVLVAAVMLLFENNFVYFPGKYDASMSLPAGAEVVTFKTADGCSLCGWYLPRPNAHAAILLCQGNGGNVSYCGDLLRELSDAAQASILIFDYRGYGRNDGTPSEAGLYADARAARQFLAEREGIAERDVVLIGESLGGGVAVDLAAADGARALILIHTFTTLPDAAAYHFPWLPVRWLMRNRYDSLSKIGRYHGPLLQTHGTADGVVPIVLGRRLFAAANEPKRFVEIPGANHNDALYPEFYEATGEFVSRLPPLGNKGNR